jgi:hypothetical protein
MQQEEKQEKDLSYCLGFIVRGSLTKLLEISSLLKADGELCFVKEILTTERLKLTQTIESLKGEDYQ